MSPSAAQFRAARAFLGLSRGEAAFAAGLHTITVGRAERGEPQLTPVSLDLLTSAYTVRGIAFGGNGLQRTRT